jgi:hypothetical protein
VHSEIICRSMQLQVTCKEESVQYSMRQQHSIGVEYEKCVVLKEAKFDFVLY